MCLFLPKIYNFIYMRLGTYWYVKKSTSHTIINFNMIMVVSLLTRLPPHACRRAFDKLSQKAIVFL